MDTKRQRYATGLNLGLQSAPDRIRVQVGQGRPVTLFSDFPLLLVDDKPIMLDLVQKILKRIGLRSVDTAPDGLTALDLLHQKAYGLVISDLHMAPLSGLDLLRKIRADEKLRLTPFLLMSGDGDPYALSSAKHAGLDNFILKPFTPAALAEKLSEML